MKITGTPWISVIILIYLSFTFESFSQIPLPANKANSETNQTGTKYGALAIDRNNGFYFGWANDCATLSEAEKKAIDECNKKGGRCTIILSFSGAGCLVYRFITGNVGMGYGWGLAKTKEEADVIAKKECAERSYGLPAPNMIYRCNSPNSGELIKIYDAHNEIKSMVPGTVSDY